jgi:acyl-ACP thioesterase
MQSFPPNQFVQTHMVTSADVDFHQKLRWSSLTNMLIQVAANHAELLEWGVDLIKYNLVWVLSGMQIQLDEYPKWNEEVLIKTWTKGINRLFYLRDFIISNAEGKQIGRATSNWLLIDIDKRRPKLHDINSEVFKQNLDKHAIKDFVPKLAFTAKGEVETDFRVRFSDIDLNKHLTTTRYIDWVFDSYQLSQLIERMPRQLTLNFIKEVIFDEKIKMYRSKVSDNTDQFQLFPTESEKPSFLAELVY